MNSGLDLNGTGSCSSRTRLWRTRSYLYGARNPLSTERKAYLSRGGESRPPRLVHGCFREEILEAITELAERRGPNLVRPCWDFRHPDRELEGAARCSVALGLARPPPRSPMLEPRRVIQTQLEMRGSENNTRLFLPCLGWVGIRGSPEKQASLHRCQAGARRFLKRSRLDGARTQLRAQVQHAGHPGNSLHEVCMENADLSARNWRRTRQVISDVQKTGPNGWS